MAKIVAKNIENYDNIARVINCVRINFTDSKAYNAVKDILTFCDIVFTSIDNEMTLFADKGAMDNDNLATLIEM